jgi:serine/threonine-protein kinase RsbT
VTGHEYRIAIAADSDMIPARAAARRMATELGFTQTDATLIATAVSEIARNIVVHVGSGEILLRSEIGDARRGVIVVASDRGPGIRDIEEALNGSGSRGGLGLGIPGARRLMDEFEIRSSPTGGTIVTMKKWRVPDELERLRARRAQR